MGRLYVVQMTKSKVRSVVPIIVLFVFLPVLIGTIASTSSEPGDMQTVDMIRQLHVWIPLFSGWWTIVFAHDFFSVDGNELMYLYHRTTHILAGQIVGMLIYLFLVCVSFTLYDAIYPMEQEILYQLLLESMMVCNLTFFTCFLFQNTGAALMIIVVYCIYLNLFDALGMFRFLSVFPQKTLFTKWDNGMPGKALAGALVFCASGTALSKIRRVYR